MRPRSSGSIAAHSAACGCPCPSRKAWAIFHCNLQNHWSVPVPTACFYRSPSLPFSLFFFFFGDCHMLGCWKRRLGTELLSWQLPPRYHTVSLSSKIKDDKNASVSYREAVWGNEWKPRRPGFTRWSFCLLIPVTKRCYTNAQFCLTGQNAF